MQILVFFLVPAAVMAVIGATSVSPSTAASPAAAAGLPPASSREGPGAGSTSATAGAPPGTNSSHQGSTHAPTLGFTWPMSPLSVIHRRFEPPRTQWSRGHRGVDLLATAGQPVLSAGEGIVAFSGMLAGRGVMTVRHSGGLRTTYEPVDERLPSGTRVHRGARIGVLSAIAGHCSPRTCLHWGAIRGTTYLDPLSLLGFGRPILLPLG